jgi:hypothetical protein
MKKHLLFTLVAFLFMTSLGFGQVKFKEFVWDEMGLSFKVPSFVKVNEQTRWRMELESEDFLIYVDYVDEFDDLDELVEFYEVKQVTKTTTNINKKTYKGASTEGFIESIELGDELNIYNVFLNTESKFNDNEKIAFDISVYEWNDNIKSYIEQIIDSIEFFEVTD